MELPYVELESWSFHVASDKHRETYGTARVTTKLIDLNTPRDGSLYDMRMGVNNDSADCRTCGHRHKLCPKHFGYIPLAIPMINPATAIFTELKRWLQLKCFFCPSNMIDPTTIPNWSRVPAAARLRFTAERLKAIATTDKILNKADPKKIPACPGCGRQHPLILTRTKQYRAQFFIYLVEPAIPTGHFLKSQEIVMTSVMVEQVIKRVTDADVRLMGHDPEVYHPINFLKHNSEVAPVNLRATQVLMGSTKPKMDPLTMALAQMIRDNETVAEVAPLFREDINQVLSLDPPIEVVQNHALLSAEPILKAPITAANSISNVYYQYLTGKTTTTATRLSRDVPTEADSSIAKIMHGKVGLIRQDALGSRNHNRSRMVIYNVPTLQLDQVLLPYFALLRLRRTTVVTERNYEFVRRLLLNGSTTYPGAFGVERAGAYYSVDAIDVSTFDLQLGDRVDRMMLEDEYITINRQPSTLLTNIGSHRIRVNPNPNEFAMGLNIEVCPCYNADFDGDQMAGYGLKAPGAVEEARMLTRVDNYFMSGQHSVPIWGLSQDSRTMIAELTRSNVRISRAEAMVVCEHISMTLIFDKPYYTGRELISMVLPPIDYKKTSGIGSSSIAKWMNLADDELEVVIKNGQVLSGIFDSAIVAPVKHSIFDVIFARYGVKTAMLAIFNLQQLALAFSRIAIFSLSPRDFIIMKREAIEEIHQAVTATLLQAEPIITNYQRGMMTTPTDRTLEEHFESKMAAVLKTEPIEIITKSLPTSSLVLMIVYGTRGNKTNLISITASAGQTMIDGKRIARTFDYKRANIYAQRGDLSPEACGYVTDPFISGIKPQQYFMQAQEARSTIIKKALATAQAGAMCRLMVRNTESIAVTYWHAVVCHRRIVQLLFADNNFDPACVSEYAIPHLLSSDAEFKAAFAAPKELDAVRAIFDAHFALLKKDRASYRRSAAALQAMQGRNFFPTKQRFPLNISENVLIMQQTHGVDSKPSIAALSGRMQAVYDLCEWFTRSSFSDWRGPVPRHYLTAYSFMQYYVRACLHPGVVVKMSQRAFEALLQLIRQKFMQALVPPNDAIGIRSATETSEPITQREIDSQHATGGDRINTYTLTDTEDNVKARDTTENGRARMWLRVKSHLEGDKAAVERVANSLQIVILEEFMEQMQVFYEHFNQIQHPAFQRESAIYDAFAKMSGDRPPASKHVGDHIAPYCIRIQLDRAKILAKNINVVDVVQQLYAALDDIYIVYNHINDTKFPLILRIHLLQRKVRSFGKDAGVQKVIDFAHKILKITIRGVEGITQSAVYPIMIWEEAADGSMAERNIFMIYTRGSNALGLAMIPEVEPTSIETSSMHETNKIFGLPVARVRIIQEWWKILPGFVPSYFIFLTDVMTSTARITPLSRIGNANREPNNVLLNMGTGQVMGVLFKAGLNDITNPMYGLSAPLISGQTITHGTGGVQCGYDPAFLAANKPVGTNDLLSVI